MGTKSQNKPCEPQLIASVNVPVVLGYMVVSEKWRVYLHHGVAYQFGDDLFELYSEKISLEQKSYHHRCYRVNDH